jgi:hypothetical protein
VCEGTQHHDKEKDETIPTTHIDLRYVMNTHCLDIYSYHIYVYIIRWFANWHQSFCTEQ